jgi:lysozyme
MTYGILKFAGALAAAGFVGICGWTYATGWHPDVKRYPLQGIDLAENAGPVEWGTVRASGADFAYIIATSGTDRRDPGFEANWAALPEAGLRRGAVHVYSLCQRADEQANAFNTFVPRTADSLPTAVDIAFHDDCTARPDRAVLIADLARFATMVETHTAKPVMFRISKSVDATYDLSAALQRPLWAVANVLVPSYTSRQWRIWRASDFRRIDGITGPVNWDVVAS